MEWWAFFFEHLCRTALRGVFQIPGDRYGNITFDARRSVNWDFKAKAIRSDDHRAILNDKTAMNRSFEENGAHGVVMALCDVEYNDANRTFQAWHTQLKGGRSKYEESRILRTATSRYRKTMATLEELLFLSIDATNVEYLDTMRQGRNSNGNPRAEKYMLNLDGIERFLVDRLTFSAL